MKKGGWKSVPYRYRASIDETYCRISKRTYGIDEESGYPHLWHIICNCAFLCELEANNGKRLVKRVNTIVKSIAATVVVNIVQKWC